MMDESGTTLKVSGMADIGTVRRAAKDLASEIGFEGSGLAALDIVVSELTTNIAVHAEEGEVIVSMVGGETGKGIEIVARDQGPGIQDLKAALKDRFSTGGSMGCGLGSVKRLVDEFDIYSWPAQEDRSSGRQYTTGGTIVSARKWLSGKVPSSPFVWSGYSRALPGCDCNGDAFYVKEEEDGLLVAVADGLGHGEEAAAASRKAMEFIKDNPNIPFERLLIDTHNVLHKTRGVALTIIRLMASYRTILHAGIGNVETRVYPGKGSGLLLPESGILGYGKLPKQRMNKTDWPAKGALIIFTDGISGKWTHEDFPKALFHNASTIAHMLFQRYQRQNDDATIVVIKENIS